MAFRAEAEAGEMGTLDAGRLPFVLQERGFYNPPDWHLQLVADPGEWFEEVVLAIHGHWSRSPRGPIEPWSSLRGTD
ncbi:MAG: hypothetical protein FWD12_11395 [Alphaproteobacteria bacterium]|nr:hypothetical protein [Alphaproteobacteria bacterium]